MIRVPLRALPLVAIALLLCLNGGANPRPVYAASIVVETLADADPSVTNGACSLREALYNASNNAATWPDCAAGSAVSMDTITFSVSGTITLAAPLPATIDPAGLVVDGANAISVDGGGVHAGFTFVTGAVAELKRLAIRNTASFFGAGVRVDASTVTLTAVSLEENLASRQGGGLWIGSGGTLTIQDSYFGSNLATFNGPGGASGGALTNDGGTVTITNTQFAVNKAEGTDGRDGRGGAIANLAGVMTITNSLIGGANTAVGHEARGGGIYNASGATLTVTGSTIYTNIATGSVGRGGGVYNDGTLTVTSSTVRSNTADDEGGGIAQGGSGSTSVWNSTVTLNTAGNNGGGGFFTGGGGALDLRHTTVSHNTAPFGGGFTNSGSTTLRNSLVANNGISQCNGNLAGVGVNLVHGGGCNIVGGTLITGDPLLGSLAGNGGPTQTRALGAGSAALNAGDLGVCTSAGSVDQRGVARPQGSGCDLGAYEAAEVSITPSSVPHLEGNTGTTAYAFTVSLSAAPPVGGSVTVTYQTSDGSATLANNDYVAVPPTNLVFNPGETSKPATVFGKGDTTPELDRYFNVDLTGAANAVIATANALAVLINDDGIEINVTPAGVSFGAQAVGVPSAPQVVMVQSLGVAPALLNVGAISVIGPNAADFAKSADTCSNNSVAAGNQCTLSVTFTPGAIGPRSATLRIQSNDFDENPVNVLLSGTGSTGTIGGKNLTIATTAADFVRLSWDGGTAQNSYTLLQYNTTTAAATLYSLGNFTSVLDNTTSPGVVYCYVLAALNGATFLGLSDLLCGMPGAESGTVIPQNFNLKLGGTANATMTWAAPVGGADSYLLQRIPLDGSPISNVALGGGVTTSAQAVVAAGTCFQLIAFKGAGFGTSDVLCGVPGVGTLGAGGPEAAGGAAGGPPARLMGDAAAAPGGTPSLGAGEALGQVAERLQALRLPG